MLIRDNFRPDNGVKKKKAWGKVTGSLVWMLILVLMTGLLTGCTMPWELLGSASAKKDEQTYYAYYISTEKNQLVEEKLNLEDGDEEALLKKLQKVVTTQLEGKEAKKKEALLPAEVSIEDMQNNDGVLSIYLSKDYVSLQKSKEILIRAGLVKTFTQIPGVDSVLLLVDGSQLADSDGKAVGPLKASSFVASVGEDINRYQSEYITMYFSDETGTALVREGRKIYYTSSSTLEKAIVTEIISGPLEAGHYATMLPETKVISVTRQDDICYVNLSGTTSTSTPIIAQENIRIYSIVNTLVENCKVKQVQFSINGDNSGTFAGTISMNQLFKEDLSLVAER